MPDDLAAWLAVLDRFERALDAADAEAGADVEPAFEPPPGPPPAELVERARAVLARQRLTIDALVVSRAATARELAALRRVPSAPADTPAYLDVEG
ncbi:hypothetical protein [Microbacterium capsulatum]|uniref:Uncharacterized protein n=1 Tax=Microbacterium capsulatum TaxID=3041921 RepID=A0ABU0XDJ8_9MICO|nr:hypothetical protein [Microbacterium sp. ASV81]MDQ4213192.1 hypothetical protein [Microbacterium sp. ASV81]